MIKRRLILIIAVLYIVLGSPLPVKAELLLTPEEKDYIAKRTVIRAASIDGGAPLHYIDSKGAIRGIAVRVLDEIAEMTGLVIEYELYDSISEVFASNPDIAFGVTEKYAPEGLVLSKPYLKTEAILYINSSIDITNLEDKIHAAIKGGSLPEGVKEENTIYYNCREETMDAVEFGKADYGYGNAYSVAFYTLQNGYKNIITIPTGKEARDYCMGFPQKDGVLLDIVNKSIEAIDETKMQAWILDETTHIDRKITFSMILGFYGKQIFGLALLVIGILIFSVVRNIHTNNQLEWQNWRYERLSQISNECLYEYSVKTRKLTLSNKFIQIFGIKDEYDQVVDMLKKTLLNNDSEDTISVMRLPLANGGTGVFKAINSSIDDDQGRTLYIIGKLVDISEEMAEKEELITKSQMDGLTGLYNAVTTEQLINKRIKNRNQTKTDAFIILDCDDFKDINDTFGHLKGNQSLGHISAALKLTFRQTDIIGRIGGDEFCVYMKDIPSIDFVESKCLKLSTLVQELGQDLQLSVSVGVAILDGADTYEGLFSKADNALYEAKRQGPAQVVVNRSGQGEIKPGRKGP